VEHPPGGAPAQFFPVPLCAEWYPHRNEGGGPGSWGDCPIFGSGDERSLIWEQTCRVQARDLAACNGELLSGSATRRVTGPNLSLWQGDNVWMERRRRPRASRSDVRTGQETAGSALREPEGSKNSMARSWRRSLGTVVPLARATPGRNHAFCQLRARRWLISRWPSTRRGEAPCLTQRVRTRG
jgi:hypothetical protein